MLEAERVVTMETESVELSNTVMAETSELQQLWGIGTPFSGADFTKPRVLYSVLSPARHLSFIKSSNSQPQGILPHVLPSSSIKTIVEAPLYFSNVPNHPSVHSNNDVQQVIRPSNRREDPHNKVNEGHDNSPAFEFVPEGAIVRDEDVHDEVRQDGVDKQGKGSFPGDLILPPLTSFPNFPSRWRKKWPRSHGNTVRSTSSPTCGSSRITKRTKNWQRRFAPIKNKKPNETEFESAISKEHDLCLDTSLLSYNTSDQPPHTFLQSTPVRERGAATPTYEDYPAAYWELRSLTIQRPSDLKEDMIDRDRYRLQQISALRLRAFQQESVSSKLDSVRKWQQQIRDGNPGPRREEETSVHASDSHAQVKVEGRSITDKSPAALVVTSVSLPASGQNKLKTSVVNDTSSLAAVSLTRRQETERLSPREQGPATAEVEIGETSKEPAVKVMKASVLNLHIETAGRSPSHMTLDNVRHRESTHATADTSNRHQVQPESRRAANNLPSIGDDLLAKPQNGRPHMFTSGPARMPPLTDSAVAAFDMKARTAQGHTLPPSHPRTTGTKILRKFTRLQVFGERFSANEQQEDEEGRSLLVTPPDSRRPYLTQSRPPSYRLDLKNYPPHPHGSVGEHPGSSMKLVHVSPRRSDPVTFHFQGGEVIISRQGPQQA
ncbi:uncharacterized protein LOC112566875 [Pomacea canaliculata]|uniref:uncharacterized protein LOC112566875 n=1 Tax=Pomacea canaliculata TaxID=400727 RepID=UPI000D7288FD|nr:uncharacterized protein LOC112566875 [Pomacea canaliculata]